MAGLWLRLPGLISSDGLKRRNVDLDDQPTAMQNTASQGGIMRLPIMRPPEGLARRRVLPLIALAGLLLPARSLAVNDDGIAIAVADFDNLDTSGEAADRTSQHAERVQNFGRLLRDDLAVAGNYRIVRLQCGQPMCSASSLGGDALIAAARHAGARLLVYGGIHKMSTLVQWGELQVVNLDREQLLLRRSFTFRGDSDEAFRHAAVFIRESLTDIAPP
jgi:Protein of unknown function (DUF2380)